VFGWMKPGSIKFKHTKKPKEIKNHKILINENIESKEPKRCLYLKNSPEDVMITT